VREEVGEVLEVHVAVRVQVARNVGRQ
jgi:hypothetical protein